MNNLRYSTKAFGDIDEIRLYIKLELQNPAAAHKIVTDILDTIEKLRDFPNMGAELSTISKIESDYRYLVCGNYIAFYHVVENDIHIDRIVYGKRDYLRILLKNNPKNLL